MGERFKDVILSDFFESAGRHPNPHAALNHFEHTFEKPLKFDELVTELTPVEGCKKVVVVDGHPRSGKTWLVLAAVNEILRRKPELRCWNSGIDSLKIFPEMYESIAKGCRSVQENLRRERASIVLLDDFLGTNRPRDDNLARLLEEKEELACFFSWNPDNPWLAEMPETSVLILTGRSLFFLLYELLLDVEIRVNSENGIVHSSLFRRGLFRTIDADELFGSFSSTQLVRIGRSNEHYHPQKANRLWMLSSSPILAFAFQDLTSEEWSRAAYVTFGEDLATLARLIQNIEEEAGDEAGCLADPRLERLDPAYGVSIAPGILFIGRNAYKSLGVGDKMARLLVNDLYLYETSEDFASGRLPNELYMKAVSDHLEDWLCLAARVYRRLAMRRDIQATPMKLALRGLVERGLKHPFHFPLRQLNYEEAWWKDLIAAYQLEEFDPLLHLELVGGGAEYDEKASLKDYHGVLNPGLSGALGFSIYEFFDSPEHERFRIDCFRWMANEFKTLLAGQHAVKETVSDEDEYNMLRDPIAVYSTFLQWSIKMPVLQEQVEFLDSLKQEFVNDFGGTWAGPLVDRVIPLDEYFWGVLENRYDLTHLDALNCLNELFAQKEILVGPDETQIAVGINCLFSLQWHNRWMDGPCGQRAESNGPTLLGLDPWQDLVTAASEWSDAIWEVGTKLIGERPILLFSNLQYHWCHFVTQYAQWMREWCFQSNPHSFELERSQITRGSRQGTHNARLGVLAISMLNNLETPLAQVRNLLLLVGTRTDRFLADQVEDMQQAVDNRLRSGGERERSAAAEHVLQALFELARQEFLDLSSKTMANGFREWCKRIYKDQQPARENAWKLYYAQLKKLTHPLDLRPGEDQGWRDLMPPDWKI